MTAENLSTWGRSCWPVAWLPNEDGFEFVAVFWNYSTAIRKIIRDENGHHRIDGTPIGDLRGWRMVKEKI